MIGLRIWRPNIGKLNFSLGIFFVLIMNACGSDHSGNHETLAGAEKRIVPDQPLLPGSYEYALHFQKIDFGSFVPVGITDFYFLPGREGEFLLAEHKGQISHFRLYGNKAKRLGGFQIPSVFLQGECGLMSITLHPNFEENNYIFASYCYQDATQNRLARFSFSSEDYESIPSSLTLIGDFIEPRAKKAWHNSGSLGFEDDDVLWILIGDNTISENSQDSSNNLGALLRIVPQKEGGYMPAPGNAFVEGEGSPDIFAFGFRNPWRGFFDKKRKCWWVGDVGGRYEEVNKVSNAGENFGWPLKDGLCKKDCEGFTNPVITFHRRPDHPYAQEDPGTVPILQRAVWVGEGYEPNSVDRYDGRFNDVVVFGDHIAGWVRALRLSPDGSVNKDEILGNLPGISAWRPGTDGYIYVTTYGRYTLSYDAFYRVQLNSNVRN